MPFLSPPCPPLAVSHYMGFFNFISLYKIRRNASI
jgi:hypothetical protein